MHTIDSDSQQNCLYITLSGVVVVDAAQQVQEKILTHLEQLEDGFSVINNISEAEYGYVSCVPLIKEVMETLVQHQVGRVIRVVKPGIFLSQLSTVSNEVAAYPIETVATIEEAQTLLDSTQP